ncbi:hypothetical protein [Natronorubrum halophilum]|uniref:hypothetical protein n=1 Tax=Natronorubrum halophilum TaxID=1702106 RepID=UPI0010C1BF91|nr:hypothetical protein [Natronorubrum halophilum]
MAETLRSSVGEAFADFGRSVGTFVGFAWTCFIAGMVLYRAAGASLDEVPVPEELLIVAIIGVAFLGTSWFIEGGYDRIGADPDGGATFAWLALFFVPLAFLPSRMALGSLAGGPGVLDALFLLGTVLFSGWLAFYGGLERLGLVPDDFIRVIVYAIAIGVIAVAVVVLFDIARLSTDLGGAAVAMAVQLAACWLGFTKDVP